MTEPKTPETPETKVPDEIVEFVDRIPTGLLVAAILAGIVVGAVVMYLVDSLRIEDATDA